MPDPTAPVQPPMALQPSTQSWLVARCMRDAGFASLMLGKFQHQLGEMTARVERAAAAGDAAEAGRAAHALKGAAANLSAGSVRAAAGAIEASGQRGDAAAVEAGLAELREAVERCRAYIPPLTIDLQRRAAA